MASTLALVLVVSGGAAYAAPSIGTALAKNSVTTKSIKNGAVTTPKLATGAVTSTKVRDGSLLAKDFKSGQLPAGPRGATGPQGSTGPQGATGPSDGYWAGGNFSDVLTSDRKIVTSFVVPAGSYILNGNVTITENSGVSPAVVVCELAADGTGLPGAFPSAQVDAGGRASLSPTASVTVIEDTTLALQCAKPSGAGNLFYAGQSLTAIKVGTLHEYPQN